MLNVAECSARVADNFTVLHQQTSKSDGARVDYHFGLESRVEIRHHMILGQGVFQLVECFLLLVGPLPGRLLLG